MKSFYTFKNQKLFFLAAAIIYIWVAPAITPALAGDDLLTMTAYSSSTEISEPGQKIDIVVKVEVADKWHIHSHLPNEDYLIDSRLSLAGYQELFALENISYPAPRQYHFAFSDKPVSVFENTFYISGTIAMQHQAGPGNYAIPLELTYQACTDSACSAPAAGTADLKIKITNPTPITARQSDNSGVRPLSDGHVIADFDDSQVADKGLFSRIAASGLAVSLLLVFLGGLGLNLTPCVYPIIPITISYFGAQSEGRTWRLFALGLLYVIGMAVTYSIIGVVSAMSGAFFGGLLQQPAVIAAIAAVFVFLAFGMFGVYDFRLPDSWVARASGSRTGIIGALLMGLTMGIIAAPCIGPLVLGLVAYVAAVGDPVYGFLLFFFLALGLGSPYLLLALFAGKIKNLPRSGEWMEGVKHIFGLILLAMAVYFATPLLPAAFREFALPVFGILAACYALFFDRAGNAVTIFKRLKIGISLVVLGLSIFCLVPSESQKAQWPAFSEPAYQKALANQQKMIMVFHADWCIPCKELDKITFSSKRVQEALENFQVFQIDLTLASDQEARKVGKRFGVLGVPTIILMDSGGSEADRITGFVDADEMLDTLSGVK